MRRLFLSLLALALLSGLSACERSIPTALHLGWQDMPATSMTVSWQAPSADGACTYGKTEDMRESQPSRAVEFEGGWLHEVELTGLTPGSAYHYRCESGETAVPQGSFTTAVPPGVPFTFVAWGDSRSDAEARRRVRAAVQARAPAFSIFTGDLVEDGRKQGQWDAWFTDMQPLASESPILPALGNHEEGAAAYFTQFVLPRGAEGAEGYEPEAFYSFDYGNVHFLALSTEPLGDVEGPQYRWAEQDLAEAAADPDIDFIVLYGHRPPYSSGSHGSALEVRAWMPLFERHGVDVAFWGHDHHYERLVPLRGGSPAVEGGITHVVTGGAGAPLRRVEPGPLTAVARSVHHFVEVTVAEDALTLEARDSGGEVFDRFRIPARRRASTD